MKQIKELTNALGLDVLAYATQNFEDMFVLEKKERMMMTGKYNNLQYGRKF